MVYLAKNIDTNKALEAIEHARHLQEEYERLDRAKIQAHYEGVREGLKIAESMFHCSNYEKDEAMKEEEK